ncbi:diguanylate cyclase [Stenotrophomonas maltophilia]|uniref:GGDEF domain-containing protein n=1 Tax=Stenotrophomonas maltophilia TaxID=40324 RepID=UPI0028C44410|nr:diguanylate cyclase [Stenotrophomonas maltophilia]
MHRWAHLAGDEVLRHFAALMQHGLQGHDTLLGRYGGEEFVLVLAGSTQAEAMVRAAAIRTVLQQKPARLATGPVTFTASIGLAMDDGQGELSTLLAAADAALYRAKAAGRDRLACATPAEISRLPIADDAVPV